MYQLLTVIFGAALLIIGFAAYERYKWQKIQVNGILCEFTTDTGFVIKKIGKLGSPQPSGTPIIIENRKGMSRFNKNGELCLDDTTYIIDKDSTYNALVPENSWFKSITQVTIPKAYFKIGDPNPQMFKGKAGVDTSAVITQMMNEKATKIHARESMRADKRDEMLKKVINPLIIYVGLGVIAIVCCVSAYFSYKTGSDMSDIANKVEIIRKAVGGQ
jgi:hypothetical protein